MPIRMTLIINPTTVANTPRVTNTSTIEETQSTNGLIITRNPLDMKDMIYFKITNISGGTVYKHDGITEISNDYSEFITHLEGLEGLKFTPDPDVTVASFRIRASTTASNVGLGGNYITARIDVVPAELTFGHTPSITNSSTVEEIQTADGLIITPNILDDVNDIYYKITSIANGTLFLFDGMTEIAEDSFITGDEGAAGLKFTPNSGLDSGSFGIQASTTNSDVGLGGDIVFATITVTSAEILAPAWSETNPAVVLAWMQATFNKASTGTPSYTVGPSASGFVGSVLAPNGKVILVPYSASNVGIYDPSDNSLTSGPAATGFRGGCLIPDGRIVMVPGDGTGYTGLYDPVTNTIIRETGLWSTGFTSGVTLADGKVLFVPYGTNIYLQVYDPIAHTVVDILAGSGGYYWGGVRCPNGDVLMCANGRDNFGIWDASAGAFVEGAVKGSGTWSFSTPRLLTNGKVMCPSWNVGAIGIYDLDANTLTAGASIVDNYICSGLLPSGGVVLVIPYANPKLKVKICSSDCSTIIDGPLVDVYNPGCRSTTLMPNGKLLVVPVENTSLGIFDPACGTIPIESLLTPWINHY